MSTRIPIVLFLLTCGCGGKNVILHTADQLLFANMKEQQVQDFAEYKKEGVILPGTVRVFGNSTKAIGQLQFDEFRGAQILEKTKSMYSLIDTTLLCAGANFLKVNVGSTVYTVFGQDVYEINNDQRFTFQDDSGAAFEIFPAANFEIGAGNEQGLTGCDGYSLLIIKRLKDEHYSLVENPQERKELNAFGGKSSPQFLLFNDFGLGENIEKVTFSKGLILVDLKITHQESSGTRQLTISYHESLSKVSMAEEMTSADF